MVWNSPHDGYAEIRLVVFGLLVRRARNCAGLSQQRLSELCGVSQSVISRLERGKAPRLALERVLAIQEVLGGCLPLGICPHEHLCIWQPRSEHELRSRHAPSAVPGLSWDWGEDAPAWRVELGTMEVPPRRPRWTTPPIDPSAIPAAQSANPAAQSANPAAQSANPAAQSANLAAQSASPAAQSANPDGQSVSATETTPVNRLGTLPSHPDRAAAAAAKARDAAAYTARLLAELGWEGEWESDDEGGEDAEDAPTTP